MGASRGISGALVIAAVVAGLSCRPDPPPAVEVESQFEGAGGVLIPGGFLHLRTQERDAFQVAQGAPAEALERYRGILSAGSEAERPPEVLSHRKVAASAALLLAGSGGEGLPLLPNLFMYDYTVCQGLLREARASLFEGASSDDTGRVVALRLWPAGAVGEREDWVLLYPGNGALTGVPRPGKHAVGLVPPLAAALAADPRPERRLTVRLDPTGRFAAGIRRDGTLEVASLKPGELSLTAPAVWDCAWHPSLPLLYAATKRGLEVVEAGSGTVRPLPMALLGGESPRALEVDPSGGAIHIVPTGGSTALYRVALGLDGIPTGPARPLPAEAAQASARVWEPGGRSVIWCFDGGRGVAVRLDAYSGRHLGTWFWDPAAVEVRAVQTASDRPTVTLQYAAEGHPEWQRFTAWLDPETMAFHGVSEKPPVDKIEWRVGVSE